MKAVILAGGTQSTVTEEYENIPKPMAEIGEKPLLWHTMKILSVYGINEFIICGGYRINVIKDYFRDFYIYQSDITVDLQSNAITCHKNVSENWKVTVVDTGITSSPGERLLQIAPYTCEEDFIVVHGDCVSNINIKNAIKFHKKNNRILTLTVAKPTGRSESLPVNKNGFYLDKDEAVLPQNQSWADACCRIFKNDIFTYLRENSDIGQALFRTLTDDGQMICYFHNGFWCPMETRRDKSYLENLWKNNKAPWKIW